MDGSFIERAIAILTFVVLAVFGIPAMMVGNAIASTWTAAKTDTLIGGGLAIGGLAAVALVLMLGTIMVLVARARGSGALHIHDGQGAQPGVGEIARAAKLQAETDAIRAGRRQLPASRRQIIDVTAQREFEAARND